MKTYQRFVFTAVLVSASVMAVPLSVNAQDREGEIVPQLAVPCSGEPGSDVCPVPATANSIRADVTGVMPLVLAQFKGDDRPARGNSDAGTRPSAPPTAPYMSHVLGEFESVAVIAFRQATHPDPLQLRLGNPKPTSFELYGEHPGQYEEIVCERSVGFDILLNANVMGGISFGVCDREAQRVRKLVSVAKQNVDVMVAKISSSGGKIDPFELKQRGWTYEKDAGPEQSVSHYFPVILIGHGIMFVSTAVMFSEKADKAVIVQVNGMNLCDNVRALQSQTVLCSDPKGAVKDIAQRLSKRLNDQ